MKKLLLLLMVVAMVASATAVFTATVNINGQPLPATPPAIERGGRVLLPMRTVFEGLGANVNWMGATRTARATQGNTTVQLSIGQSAAYVNGRPVTLDVPPQLIGGVTYVPVRFPAEAFGAQVGWNAATRTVDINLPQVAQRPQTGQAPPTLACPPQRPAQAGSVVGTISAVNASQVTLTVCDRLQSYQLSPASVLLSQGFQGTVGDLRPGDLARVDYDARGNVISLRASYDTYLGVVLTKTPNGLLLEGNTQPFSITPQARVISDIGATVNFNDISIGDQVTLRVTPNTRTAYHIAISQGPAGDLVTVTPSSMGPFRPGDRITITVNGPARARVTYSIGVWQRNMAMQEATNAPGVYTDTFTVPRFTSPRTEPIIVSVRANDGRILTARTLSPLQFGSYASLRPRFISPDSGEFVGSSVTIEGYTIPFALVNLDLGWRGLVEGRQRTGQLLNSQVSADRVGHFIVGPIALNLPQGAAPETVRYTLTAVAQTPQGQQSDPTVVSFNQQGLPTGFAAAP